MKARMPDHAMTVGIQATGTAWVRLSVPLLTAISIVTRMPSTKPNFGLNCIVDLLHFHFDAPADDQQQVAGRNLVRRLDQRRGEPSALPQCQSLHGRADNVLGAMARGVGDEESQARFAAVRPAGHA